MLRRFNLQFSIYDDARFEAEEGAFDFGNDQLVLSPWSFIKHNVTARMLLLESDWDFVIVDEAHHLNLGEEAQDELDVTLTQLARNSRGLLLLTATPGQSGVDSHFSRLQLLDPDRFSDLDKFTEEQRQFEQTFELIERLRAGEDVSNLPAGIDPTQSADDIRPVAGRPIRHGTCSCSVIRENRYQASRNAFCINTSYLKMMQTCLSLIAIEQNGLRPY